MINLLIWQTLQLIVLVGGGFALWGNPTTEHLSNLYNLYVVFLVVVCLSLFIVSYCIDTGHEKTKNFVGEPKNNLKRTVSITLLALTTGLLFMAGWFFSATISVITIMSVLNFWQVIDNKRKELDL